MDVNERIQTIMKQKGLTYYQLAKRSGLAQSTLSNMSARGTVPSIYTLEQICKGLQISMAEFFMVDSHDIYCLTEFQVEFLKWFMLLDEIQQVLILKIVKQMVKP